MMNLWKLTALAAVTLSVTALPVLACSCPPSADAAAQAAKYELVAEVTVEQSYIMLPSEEYSQMKAHIEALEMGGDEAEKSIFQSSNPYGVDSQTRMKVTRILKGDAGEYVIVNSAPAGMPACGVSYSNVTTTVLLANKRDDGSYGAWMCSLPQFTVEEFDAALSKPVE